MELMHAAETGVPVILWYTGNREHLSPWVEYHIDGRWQDLEQCFSVLRALNGENDHIGA